MVGRPHPHGGVGGARRGLLEDAWAPLYGSLAGNPLAAMPSLHFATSIMAAHLLGEAGRVQGAVAWSYALALGFALVPRAHGGVA